MGQEWATVNEGTVAHTWTLMNESTMIHAWANTSFNESAEFMDPTVRIAEEFM